jgi:hypothetical protein
MKVMEFFAFPMRFKIRRQGPRNVSDMKRQRERERERKKGKQRQKKFRIIELDRSVFQETVAFEAEMFRFANLEDEDQEIT